MKSPYKSDLPGLILSLILGIVAWLTAKYTGWMNAVMMALLMGVVLGNSVKVKESLNKGIAWSASNLLELSIVFLGFEVSYQHINKLGIQAFAGLALMVVAMLFITKWLSNRLKCPGQTGLLIGFGTAICGSSAIAAAAPRIAADKTDAGISIAVVNLLGAIGMLVIPAVLPFFISQSVQLGFFTGASLHAVGNVAGAAFAMDDASGEYALTVKLARVALLSPALIIYGIILREKSNASTNDGTHKNVWYRHLNLPLYLWLFIAAGVVNSTGIIPEQALKVLHTIGKILLSSAMFAIGIKLSIRKLYKEGRNALGFGLIIFAVQILLVSVLVIFLQ